MGIVVDIPQIAYRTWVIEYHTGDKELDYKLEKDLRENCKKVFDKYPYSADHPHVK